MELLKSAYYTAAAAYSHLSRRRPFGRSIYTADWDLCIVLDSCRVDMLRECCRQLSLDWDIGTAWSRGSMTTEWLAQTFRSDEAEVRDTMLLSANPHTTTVFDDRDWIGSDPSTALDFAETPAATRTQFGEVIDVWTQFAEDHSAVPPEVMRDATLEAMALNARHNHDRVVAHWLQPHEPWIAPDAPIQGGEALDQYIWPALCDGEADPQLAWEAYWETLAWTLPFVEQVLSNVDATVLITADHGNLFGEVSGLYGHPYGNPLPAVRKVPWVTIEADGSPVQSRPDILETCRQKGGRRAATEQLEALGYR